MSKINLKEMLISKQKEAEKNSCYFCKLNRQIEAKNVLISNNGKKLIVKIKGAKGSEGDISEVEINYCPICGERVSVREIDRIEIENSPAEQPKDKSELLNNLS